MGIEIIEIVELNKRITLQAQRKTPTLKGGFTITWVDIAIVWAKTWSVSSNEKTESMQSSLERIQKFKIRYRNVLKASWRIKYGDRYFNIIGLDPDDKNIYMFITCKESA